MLSISYITATHNIAHSPWTSTCTTHPVLSTPLSSTILSTQSIVTKMAQDVEVMWKCCGVIPILFGWFLSVPSLHALVFVQKTFCDSLLYVHTKHNMWQNYYNELVLCSTYSGRLWASPTLAELTCLCVWKWYCSLNHDTLWLHSGTTWINLGNCCEQNMMFQVHTYL